MAGCLAKGGPGSEGSVPILWAAVAMHTASKEGRACWMILSTAWSGTCQSLKAPWRSLHGIALAWWKLRCAHSDGRRCPADQLLWPCNPH